MTVRDVQHPCIGINLLTHACQQEITRRFVAMGHRVQIRRDRNGSRKVRLDGRRTELCLRDALERMEAVVFPPRPPLVKGDRP